MPRIMVIPTAAAVVAAVLVSGCRRGVGGALDNSRRLQRRFAAGRTWPAAGRAVPSPLGGGSVLERACMFGSDRVGAMLEPLLDAACPAVLHGHLKSPIGRGPLRHPGSHLIERRCRDGCARRVGLGAADGLPAATGRKISPLLG